MAHISTLVAILQLRHLLQITLWRKFWLVVKTYYIGYVAFDYIEYGGGEVTI